MHKSEEYCRTHNVSVCLYIAYIACGSASLYILTLYFFHTVLALSAVATVANIKIRYDAKIPQFALFGTRVIYVIYSISGSAVDRFWLSHFTKYALMGKIPPRERYKFAILGTFIHEWLKLNIKKQLRTCWVISFAWHMMRSTGAQNINGTNK